ncbi:hypothetical protein jhhlp_006049 [Lomentospora prolificans]|uniref:Man(5)GlcNAc(2)-PP-dolichol translocation protein RFT1 n=1 Tax=Lomentospora prolificans TaxID=41688 RepID=A0A2N3N4U6_9PEZI|nr:hypothetical protein jhhlp_006049 [Lomentospora prolificans]
MANPPQASSALRGASFLIILQVTSRLLTFFANQLLLRFLTAPLLGLSARLEAYYLTVLFFARESLRVAIQRQPIATASESETQTRVVVEGRDGKGSVSSDSDKSGEQGQAVVNLGYLAVVLGVVVTAILGWFMQFSSGQGSGERFGEALRLYALAAVLELVSEPCFVLMQVRLRFGTRAAAESAGAFLRCGATLGSAMWANHNGLNLGVLPFALGQLAYGAALLVVYLGAGYGLASRDGFSIFPRRINTKGDAKGGKTPNKLYLFSYFYNPTLSLASSLMAQSVVKHFLTQGDTFLVSILSTPHAQGIYALVNNYGGLLARLLFQPIEESSRSYFSRLLSASEPGKVDAPAPAAKSTVVKARNDLQRLLKIYVLSSTAVVTLGPIVAPHLLSLVAGPSWSDSASPALAAYCFYIPLLALNGVSEAFVASVATEAQVHIQSIFMAGFSVIFGLSAFMALRVLDMDPAVGLVCANAANMVCRIVWCAFFVKRYFREHGVGLDILRLAPSGLSVGICAAAPYTIRRVLVLSEDMVHGSAFRSLVIVGAMAVPVVALLAFAERKFLMECYSSLRGSNPKSKTT